MKTCTKTEGGTIANSQHVLAQLMINDAHLGFGAEPGHAHLSPAPRPAAAWPGAGQMPVLLASLLRTAAGCWRLALRQGPDRLDLHCSLRQEQPSDQHQKFMRKNNRGRPNQNPTPEKQNRIKSTAQRARGGEGLLSHRFVVPGLKDPSQNPNPRGRKKARKRGTAGGAGRG